jgi:deoxyribodipyrimidine photolyase-related protein
MDGFTEAFCYDVADFELFQDLKKRLTRLTVLPSPNFIYSPNNALFMHHFYIDQRKRLDILMDHGKPLGGKWSYDSDNRKKISKNIALPKWQTFENQYIEEARGYVKRFHTFGEMATFYYPVTFEDAEKSKHYFFREHFSLFGDYQDAITSEDSPLFHSLLSPALNVGLIDTRELVNDLLQQEVPINAKEGFIRQIIGWREFMRRTYDTIGVKQRTTNFFGFQASIPHKMLRGETGLLPFDDVISKINKRGYAHHIERLMILGNFFLLTERSPDAVYEFFMASFIDAYDWVMVGNVYGMSQYADGGLITTKPYVSGSNYILKMSHYPKGEWCQIWDALYWRFIYLHQEKFKSNSRMQFAVMGLHKIDEHTLQKHIDTAQTYLNWLDA